MKNHVGVRVSAEAGQLQVTSVFRCPRYRVNSTLRNLLLAVRTGASGGRCPSTALLGLVSLWLSAGCGGEGPAREPTFWVDTLPGGTVLVVNDDRGTWGAREAWFAEDELRIGALEGEGPDVFGIVSAVEVDEAGNIYVAEYQASEIRVFDPEGHFLRRWGRKGEGPREFRAITGLGWDAAGNLWVQDAGLVRYSVFTTEGRLLAVHALPFPMPRLTAFRLVGTDAVLDWGVQTWYPPRDGRWEAADAPPGTVFYHPILIRFDTSAVDSFPPLRERRELIAGTRSPKPYSGRLVLHVDEKLGVWFGYPRRYRIGRRSLGGDTTLFFTLPFEPEPVTAEEKARVSRTWTPPRRVPLDQVPEEKPVLERITTDGEGRVYVFPRLRGRGVGRVMDVFGEDGVYRGRVELPVALEMRPAAPVVRGGAVYGVTRGEHDERYVVRMRLLRGR